MTTLLEERLAALDATVQSQSLTILWMRLDLLLYKAVIAKGRWGSPGGNDKAIESLETALATLDGATLPESLRATGAELCASIEAFRKGLQDLDVTQTSLNQSRLTRAFKAFGAIVTGSVNGPAGREDLRPEM